MFGVLLARFDAAEKSWRTVALTSLVCLGLSVGGCSHAPYVWVKDFPKQVDAPRDGHILRGDIVQVRVFDQENLSATTRVSEAGTVTLPLLGEVPVAGDLPTEVAIKLRERLKPFVNDPRVTVVIQEASDVSVTVAGEVRGAGVIEVAPPATVLQALARAGGLSDFADRSAIYVLREINKKTVRIRFAYQDLVDADPAATAFHLKTGDVLVVE